MPEVTDMLGNILQYIVWPVWVAPKSSKCDFDATGIEKCRYLTGDITEVQCVRYNVLILVKEKSSF